MHLLGFYIQFLTTAQQKHQAVTIAVLSLLQKAVQSCTETSINTQSPDLLLVVLGFFF